MKSLLRFIACGSVDDGKSTLIGHMLYDAKLIFTDQVKALELDSLAGSRGGELDYSLLLDGLIAEREQGITIDVAYRYFSTTKRSFIVADTPGHEQYTRNMAVGASFADLAILLVDATQGVLRQTRRHAFICSMMGIRHFVVAVNKMDLVGYDQTIFDAIRTDITELMSAHPIETLTIIPVSATLGDNVTVASDKMPWYKGPALLAYLEEVEVQKQQATSFVMPIQRVSRPDHTFRGFQGQIESGEIKTGEDITVLPTREKARIKSILLGTHLVTSAQSGQAVTVTLDREVDVSRGCVLTQDPTLGSASVLSVTLLWMDEHDLLPGRNYLIKIGTKTLPGTVTAIHDKIDIETGTRVSARHLSKNEIGSVELRLSEAAVFEAFTRLKGLGSLIMIDRITHATSACGTVVSSLKLQEELHWQKTDINKTIRANQLNQTPFTLWFTGLSGSGKSTLANELEKRLVALGKHTMLLDGDNIRMGLNKNLGFTETDRIENIRRVAEVAKLMNDAGLIVLTSFISPYEEDRMSARSIIGGDYLEIYVSTDLKTCEARDPKGLYRKARAGQIENFTGISSPYEIPANPDLTVDAGLFSVVECADQVMSLIREKL